MKKSLEIPFFPGFYGTIFDLTDTEYNYVNDELLFNKEDYPNNITADDFTFDAKAYMNAIGEEFTNQFADLFPLDFIKSVEFDEIDSPREYNFRNDRLYAFFEFDDNWKTIMRKFMDDNFEWLKDIIHKEHSSRSGFISYMSNDINDWYHILFDGDEEDVDTIYLEDMIKYMIIDKYATYDTAYKIREEIESYTLENVCESNFFAVNA